MIKIVAFSAQASWFSVQINSLKLMPLELNKCLLAITLNHNQDEILRLTFIISFEEL